MPAISSTASNEASTSQLDSILSTLSTLTDPLAITAALLVLTHALQDDTTHAITTQKILSSIPLAHFFQLLQQDFGYDTETVIDRTCCLIEALLKDQSYSTLTQDPVMVQALEQALQSPSTRVHALGCSQVDKMAERVTTGPENETGPDYETLFPFYKSNVFQLLLQGLTSDSIAIAERTKKSLVTIILSPYAVNLLFQHRQNKTMLHEMANSRNSIVQLRTLETLIDITNKSPMAIDDFEALGMLDALKSGLDSSDILTRFNIIELLAKIGTEEGTDFMDESGIFARLTDIVTNETEQDPLGVNAVIKLYGQLGTATYIMFPLVEKKFGILTQLERILVGGDETYHVSESLKQEAIAAVGLIGGNGNNLQWLIESTCGDAFAKMYGSLSRDSRVVYFHALAQILQGGGFITKGGSDVKALFDKLEGSGQSPFVGRLVTAAKSQSLELALAALSAMIKLAHHWFGVQKIGQDRDAITFLLDRNLDLTHAGKVARAEVIANMLETAAYAREKGEELLTADQISRLDLARRQGAFYQRATATVAIQDIAA